MAWAMDELEARAHRQLEALYGVQEDIGGLRVVEESADGQVRVEVDGAGGLVGLRLSATSARLGATGLAHAIVETATRAAHHALARRAALTAEFLGQFAEPARADLKTPAATTQSDPRS